MTHLKEGDPAPDFTGVNQSGEEITLSDLKGKKVILYFYPRDNTPGCTTESCNLRDNHKKLQSMGFEVLGVSNDTMRKHQNFIKKFNLPFDLIADTDKSIVMQYGVYGEKQFMGRTFDGIRRTTFVIDEKGTIMKIFEKVNNEEHTRQILEALN